MCLLRYFVGSDEFRDIDCVATGLKVRDIAAHVSLSVDVPSRGGLVRCSLT